MKQSAPRKCEHCRKDLPFGEFQLTKRTTGNVKNAVWSTIHECYVQHLTRYLCAQCGFNITSYRVVQRYEVPERVESPSGVVSVRTREILAQHRPYLACTLVTKLTENVRVMREAEKQRYYEQVQAIEAQKRARRLSLYEHRLRAIGTTVRDQNAGIQPLTEDEIQAAMLKYTNGSSRGSGLGRVPVREVVVGGASPRKGQVAVNQRASSTSLLSGATSVSRAVTPRRPR